MKQRMFLIAILLFVLTLIAACGGKDEATAPAAGEQAQPAAPSSAPNTLTAVKVDATSLDASADYWANAPVLAVDTKAALEGEPDGPTVKMQAAYDGEFLVIRSEWADATASNAKNAWTWDGSVFTKSGDEDRFMLTWPMTNNADFASKGCATACHNDSANKDEWWMGSEDPNVSYDSWHWKAARTNPAGYTDDQRWSTLTDPADPESSRPNDAKDSGGYADNVNDDGSGPLYMSSKGTKEQFIMAGDEVDIDTAALAAGDVIPGYVLAKAVGSRGDIEANGVWQDGTWVLVQRRALNTTHVDDAAFTAPKPVPFGMSVVDNGGGTKHTISPEVLTLEWK